MDAGELGRKVTTARKLRRLTQEQAADAAGISRDTWRKIENGTGGAFRRPVALRSLDLDDSGDPLRGDPLTDHGAALSVVVRRRDLAAEVLAEGTGATVRTVNRWLAGTSLPSDEERAALRAMLGRYDEVDPVETALRASTLDEWRQDTVLGFYKQHLHEQGTERAV